MFPWPREPGKCEKDTRCSDGRRGAEVRRQRGGGAVWTARAGLKKSLKLPGLQELRLQGPARPMLQGRATSHRLSVPWPQHLVTRASHSACPARARRPTPLGTCFSQVSASQGVVLRFSSPLRPQRGVSQTWGAYIQLTTWIPKATGSHWWFRKAGTVTAQFREPITG